MRLVTGYWLLAVGRWNIVVEYLSLLISRLQAASTS
jgi:hypothetical protein